MQVQENPVTALAESRAGKLERSNSMSERQFMEKKRQSVQGISNYLEVTQATGRRLIWEAREKPEATVARASVSNGKRRTEVSIVWMIVGHLTLTLHAPSQVLLL